MAIWHSMESDEAERFDELEDNLGADQIEDVEDYEVTDHSDGKNHSDELEVVEADLKGDPGAAAVEMWHQTLGLSTEDLDEVVSDIETTSEEIIKEESENESSPDVSIETEDDGSTTVTADPDGDGDVDVSLNIADDSGETDVAGDDPVIEESETDIQAVEHVRAMLGMESEADVELDVKTDDVDQNIQFEDDSITITPNDGDDVGGDDMGSDDESGDDDYSIDEEGSDDEGSDDEGSDDEGSDDESGESWLGF